MTLSPVPVPSAMPYLMLKQLPRYECLLEASRKFPDLDPSACAAFLGLLRAGDEAFGLSERHLLRHQLSQGRFGVLMLLWTRGADAAAGPRTPAELADAAGVTRATMTGLIDTLERDGFVRREPDPEDRRMHSIVLTPKAEDRLRELLPGHFRMMTALMEPLDEGERQTLSQLLAKIVAQAAVVARPPAESLSPAVPTR